MQRFTKIRAWQKAHELALEIERATRGFPSDERFGLVASLRRSSREVPALIAEGSKLLEAAGYARLLNQAEAVLARTEAQLLLATDLGHLPKDSERNPVTAIAEVARLLHGLRASVQAPSPYSPLDPSTPNPGRRP